MKSLIKITLLLVFIIGFMVLSGCTQTQSSAPQKEIKIGVVASMTGPSSTTGKDIWQSAVIAANEINARGGVYVSGIGQKIPIKLVQGDDESTREGGQSAVSRLITQDNVDLLIGGYSSAVTSSYEPYVVDHTIPYIVTGASSPIITHRNDINTSYIFHYCPTTDDYGMQTVTFIDGVVRPAINAKYNYPADRPLRLAVIYQDSPYGQGVLTAVKNTIAQNHLNIVMVDNRSFKMGENDFKTLLTGVKASNPDIVYSAALLNEQIPMIIQARRDVGLNTLFAVVEANDDPAYYSGLGQWGEGSIIESRFGPYSTPNGSLTPAVDNFKQSYNTQFGVYPGMMGASTYEGVYVAAKAIENAGSLNKSGIKDQLDRVDMPQMIEYMQNGNISFSSDFREAKFNLYMSQLAWNQTSQQLRPKIVWPDQLKETNFVIPDWYTPGNA